MADSAPRYRRLFAELKRRHVFRVAAVYGAIGFGVIEVADAVFPHVALPAWAVTLVVWFVLLGFPVALVLAWAFELTPDLGVRRTGFPSQSALEEIAAQPSRRRWRAGIAAALGALLLAAGGWFALQPEVTGDEPDPPAPSGVGEAVAVVPFRTTGVDTAVWKEGMVDMLSFNIDRLPGFRKVDPMGVLTAWERATTGRHGGSRTGSATALAVARALDARYAVTGAVTDLGGGADVRLSAEVYDLERDSLRGTAIVDGSRDAVLALVDELTIEIVRRNLLPVHGDAPPVNLSRVTTSSLPALKAYLEGEADYRRGRYEEALVHFQRAIEHDSTFSRALYRLSGSYGWLNQGQLAQEYRDKARRFAARLSERDSLIVGSADYVSQDVEWMKELAARYPDDADVWYQLGEAIFHKQGATLLPPRSYVEALGNATTLAPYYWEPQFHLLEDAFAHLDGGRADVLLQRVEDGPSRSPCPVLRLIHDARWGEGASRSEASAALGRTPRQEIECAWTMAAASRVVAERMTPWLISDVHEADTRNAAEMALWRLLQVNLWNGRPSVVRAALDEIDDVATIVAAHDLMLHLAGYADSSRAVRAARALETEPVGARDSLLSLFWLSALAAAEGRWPDFDSRVSVIDAMAEERDDEAGPLADALPAFAVALREFGRVRRGEASRLGAFEAAQAAMPTASWVAEFPAYHLRFEIGKELLERGDLQEAERYFLSLYPYATPYFVRAQHLLGRIYEASGRPEEARERYALSVEWWDDADPDVRPWRNEAVEALRRLAPDSAER